MFSRKFGIWICALALGILFSAGPASAEVADEGVLQAVEHAKAFLISQQQEAGRWPVLVASAPLPLQRDTLTRLLEMRGRRVLPASAIALADDSYSTKGLKETNDCLFLASGDRISGQVDKITPDGMVQIANPLFRKPLRLRFEAVLRIVFSPKERVMDGRDSVILLNGGRVRGDLQEITASSVLVQTKSMGAVSIKRSIVAAVDLQADKNVVFETDFSTASAEPWDRRVGKWEVRNGKYHCLTPLSFVSAEVEQEGPMTAEWTVSALGPEASSSLLFFVEDTAAGVWGQNAIYVQPLGNHVQVYQVRNGTTHPIMNKSFGRLLPRATFRAAYDPDSGRLRLWVNDMDLGQCRLSPLIKKGGFVHLYCRNPSVYESVRIVRGARGIADDERAEETTDLFIMINKDKLSGTLEGFRDGVATIQTPYGKLDIQKDKLQRIVFCKQGRQVPRRRDGDSIVVLHGGSLLSAKIKSMDEQGIEANADSMGNVKILRNAVRMLVCPSPSIALDLGDGVLMNLVSISPGRFMMALPYDYSFLLR